MFNELTTGTTNVLTEGVVYTLPAKVVFIKSNLSLDVSFDLVHWVTFTNSLVGDQIVYPFVKCAQGNAIVVVKQLRPNSIKGVYNPPALDVLNPTSFWNLEESSGTTRKDSVGTNNLTDNNTVLQVPGKIDFGAGFNGLTNYLSVPSNSSVQATGSISLACWMFLTVYAGTVGQIQTTPTSDKSYALLSSSPGVVFQIRNAANNASVSTAIVPISLNAWSFVVGVYDATAQLVKASANGGAFVSAAATTGIRAASSNFIIGGGQGTNFVNGFIDACGLWNGYALTQSDIAYLYNSGNGRQWPL